MPRGGKPLGKVKIEWSNKFAYAVGLIASDGNLSPDSRHINFTSKDLGLVTHFKESLNLNNVIGRKARWGSIEKKYYVIQFGDVLFYRFLLSIGITPNKSKTIAQLKIPDVCFFDFLRGSFDGDGTVYSYFDPRWKNSFMYYIGFVSSGNKHMLWLQKTIKRLAGVSGSISQSGDVYQLRFAKKDSRVLIKKMYYDINIPCLKRKLHKIQGILKISAGVGIW